MSKVYRLQFDLPNVKKGAEIKMGKRGVCYTCTDKYGGTASFSVKLIEGNPEWFKEQKPKEWRITCFKSYFDKYCKLDHRGLYSYDTHGGWELDVMLENFSNKIYSVERLSDNCVFSIGDKIYGTLLLFSSKSETTKLSNSMLPA